METLKDTKATFKPAFQEIVNERDSYELSEAAFPAYAHKNFLIDYLYWKRLQVAFDFIKQKKPGNRVLDFGCGSGVLSYLLAKNDFKVTALDKEFGPLNMLKEKVTFPKSIDFILGDVFDQGFQDNSFDVIIANNVLEHVHDLETYIQLFGKLLSANGVIIVSGPTENVLYKIGRKIAGRKFTGDYHTTDIFKIKQVFSDSDLNVRTIRKLIYPFVLFEVFAAEK